MHKIGLFGFGVVGSAFYRLVEQLNNRHFQIEKIVIKNIGKERAAPAHLFSNNPSDILGNEGIQIVVELIDNADDALQIAQSTLAKGKKLVTANKKMLATHISTLVDKRTTSPPIWYEAAVAGSIPIIKTLENHYAPFHVFNIGGILNGTSNYILSQMESKDKDYDAVLQEAQLLGFAESNPTLDVDGYDARNKLSLLMLHAFGVSLSTENVPLAGIRHIAKEDVAYARQADCNIRLIASAEYKNGCFSAVVAPHFIQQKNPFYSIVAEQNAVLLQTDEMAQHFLTGKGAGGTPTASAVLTDVLAAIKSDHYQYGKWRANGHAKQDTKAKARAYIRHADKELLQTLPLQQIEMIGETKHSSQLIADIALADLRLLSDGFVALLRF